MIYLLCYDISSNSIRTKIAKRIIQEGYERIQKSIYVSINNPKDNKILWSFMQKKICEDKNAKLMIIPLSRNNFYSLKYFGNFDLDIEYILGEKRSLII